LLLPLTDFSRNVYVTTMKATRLSSALSRRNFLGQVALVGTVAAADSTSLLGQEPVASARRWRAAIIGATGRGDYGHSLDLIFNGHQNVEVVAIADPDASGRTKAAERSKALRQYADYRDMLAQEKPELVCLAPRWSEQRRAMGLAALQIGAHLCTEKPFAPTLAEADELLAAADRAGLKIAVAHQMRLAPSILHLQQQISEGLIGDLLEIRAWGKQDDRAGGEDMLVLGSHLFDLLRLFAGDALSCTARVLYQGRDITRADARRVKEQIGPVAGDEVHAHFAFAHGVNATFTSRKRLRQSVGPWGIELMGSKATVRILTEVFPSVFLLQSNTWEPSGKTDQWRRLPTDPGLKLSDEERGFGRANRRVVDDWLEAIEKKREPACSGRAAMKSLEMIMAVYQAALSGTRVTLPLAERRHPLEA
jgi:predicted dehydrogenase